MELAFHVKQLFGFSFRQLENRDACGRRDHIGNSVLIHDHGNIRFAFTPGFFLVFTFLFQLFLGIPQGGSLFEILVCNSLVLIGFDFLDLDIKLLKGAGGREPLDAQARARLIDQVDSLVRQVTVLDIARGKLGRALDRLISNSHMMMVLILLAKAFEYLDSFSDSRLSYLDRLEAAFQGCVLFNILTVLICCSSTDSLEFAARQHRLEHIGSTHCTVCRPCTDDSMDLINKEHDIAAGPDLFKDFFQAFLKIAAVPGTGNH